MSYGMYAQQPPPAFNGFDYYSPVAASNNHRLSPIAAVPGMTVTANNQQQRQHQHHNNLQRVASLEEFLLLNPGILHNSSLDPLPVVPSSNSSSSPTPNDRWLDDMVLEVPGLSVEPLSGKQMVTKVKQSLEHVTQRYIPCVEFLVQCQQELRRGLAASQQQHQPRQGRCQGAARPLTARQYYSTFVQNLPQRFELKNRYFMEKQALQECVNGIHQLVAEAHHAERMGAEAVKNQFLGGMKDGQSWGLRKWMATHGNALHICTNIECIHEAVQKLDRESEATRRLAATLRPLAAEALKRLQNEIPKTYQAHSSAHPYLPFFHRLESALRSMSQFDPDDDDVIVLDDSSDDEPEPIMSSRHHHKHQQCSRKRNSSSPLAATTPKRREPARDARAKPPPTTTPASGQELDAEVDDDSSVMEVFQLINDTDSSAYSSNKKQNPQEASEVWKCPSCEQQAFSTTDTCEHCGEVNFLKDLGFYDSVEALLGSESSKNSSNGSIAHQPPPPPQLQHNGGDYSAILAPSPMPESIPTIPQWPLPLANPSGVYASSLLMADNIDRVAALFDENQQHFIRPPNAPFGQFWDGDRFAAALKLFSSFLRRTEASFFAEPVDDDRLIRMGKPPFSHVIRHPLCFRDIVAALIHDVEGATGDTIPLGVDGQLPARGLSTWNMWKGMDLLQAIDLVFLNSLAYGKVVEDGCNPKSSHRSMTNKLRKEFWDGISRIVKAHVGQADAERRRLCTPTRRAESSGFVVFKIPHH